MTHPPDRFLGRAEVYAAARPSYPAALGEALQRRGLLGGQVADLGAGTGLFTRLLLDSGATVTATEPNPEMRAQLTAALGPAIRAGRLTVREGTAEATGLPDQGVDLITAAQAAHWFDPAPTLREFRRVLRPGGHVLFVWNDWRGVEVPFNEAYGEAVAQFSPEESRVQTRVPREELARWFPDGFEELAFDHPTAFTRERLHALAGSISYLPAPGSERHPELLGALNRAFDRHAVEGKVELGYRTLAFLAQP